MCISYATSYVQTPMPYIKQRHARLLNPENLFAKFCYVCEGARGTHAFGGVGGMFCMSAKVCSV